MTVPKSRHTSSKKRRRRSHLSLKAPALLKCPKCGQAVLGHTVCLHCGYYGGKERIDVLGQLEKKERKRREKEIKTQDQGEEKKKPSLSLKELSKK